MNDNALKYTKMHMGPGIGLFGGSQLEVCRCNRVFLSMLVIVKECEVYNSLLSTLVRWTEVVATKNLLVYMGIG